MSEYLCEKVIQCRFLFLAVAFLVTIGSIYEIKQLNIYDDPLKWPPQKHPNVMLNSTIQEVFGGANVVTIQVTAKKGDIFTPEILKKVKTITDKVLLMDGVVPSYVTSLSAQKVKYMKGEADLLTIEPLMEKVPENGEEMERLLYGVTHNPLLYGPVVSLDRKSAVIIADFRTGERKSGEPTYYRTTPLDIYKGVQEIIAPENDATTSVICAGSPIIIGWVNSGGIPYVKMAFLIFILVMAIALLIIFRDWRGVVLPLLLGLITSAWGFGLYGLLISKEFGSASCLLVPFILMASATMHSVMFLRRFHFEEYPRLREAKPALVNTFSALFVPMIIALTTDVLAFSILWVVPFENVSTVGRIGTLGLLSLTVAVVVVLIPLISLAPGSKPVHRGILESAGSNDKMSIWLAQMARIFTSVRGSRVAVGVVALLFIGTTLIWRQIDAGQDNTYAIHNYLTKSWRTNPVYLSEMEIRDKFKGIYTCNLLVDTRKPDGIKNVSVLKAMDAFAADACKELECVAGVVHLPVYLKLMNRFMNEEKDEYLTLPDNESAVGDFCLMYTSGEAGAFDSVVDTSYQTAPIAIYVDSTDHKTVWNTLATVKNLVRKHFNGLDVKVDVAGGSIGIAGAFNDSINKWIGLSLLLGVLTSAMTIALIFRSIIAALLLPISPLVAVIFTLAILHLQGIEINSNTAIVASMGIGVGIDAAVYLLFRFREEFKISRAFDTAMHSALLGAGKANIASYCALVLGCWSVIPVPLYLGYTGYGMGLVLILNLLLTMSFLIALWAILKPSFLFVGVGNAINVDAQESVKDQKA